MAPKDPARTALVLGATGKFGRHSAAALEARGWTVHRFDRARDDLATEAARAGVIVVGWHPPSYDTWAQDLLPMHHRVIEAVRGTGARVILPGNVYNFGPRAPFCWGPATPQLAENPLGQLRIRQEQAYRDANIPTVVLRCGDFIDDRPSGNWFDRFITPAATRGRIAYPGPLDAQHAWAWLPDVGRAVALLAEAEGLAVFEDVPFDGYTLTGAQLAEQIGVALKRPVRAGAFAWWPLTLARPVMPVLRGVFEMRYLWSLPHRLDGARLAELCPGFTPTPLTEALRAALAHQATPTRRAA